MDKEKLRREISWKERSAKISRSWGDKAGSRKALREAKQLKEKLKEMDND